MTFVQIIEFTTDRAGELQALADEWISTSDGKRTATRSTLTRDRDRPNTYLQIVEFPSYEDAMRNSEMPETGEFAAKMTALCTGEPVFRNLDVEREDQV